MTAKDIQNGTQKILTLVALKVRLNNGKPAYLSLPDFQRASGFDIDTLKAVLEASKETIKSETINGKPHYYLQKK